MSDYTYQPQYSIDDYAEDQNITIPEPQSTTLDRLDEIEVINRHNDEFSKVENADNLYPDILKKPLYTKVVPEGGMPVSENARIQRLSETANNKQRSKGSVSSIGNMSIKEFMAEIANSLMGILNDLLCYKSGEDEFLIIFTKENRLLSIGIVFIIISVFLIFFKNTE